MKEQEKEMIAPKQWVYVIERKENHVKIGMSANPHERIKTLERAGGFHVKRNQLFGPFQNGYQVENEAHKKISSKRIKSEWFAVSFEEAVNIVLDTSKQVGDAGYREKESNSFDSIMLKKIFPETVEMAKLYGNYLGEEVEVIFAKDGKVWFESENCGMFLPEHINAFIASQVREYQPNENDEHS